MEVIHEPVFRGRPRWFDHYFNGLNICIGISVRGAQS